MTTNGSSTLDLKASLLSKGINFDLDLFTKYKERSKKDYYENTYGYCHTNRDILRKHRFPQVLCLGDDIVVSCLRRENTPWNLRIDGDNLNLYHNNDYNRTLNLPEALPFFGKRLSDGTLSDEIISVSGAVTPGFFLHPKCYYFPQGVPCGFCSLMPTRNTVGKSLLTEFNEQNISEATKLFQNTKWRDIPLITNTCGTPENDEETRRTIIEPLRYLYEALDPKIPIHVLAHPPNDLKLIHEFKVAGVTTIAFNLEIYDRERFREICPGKDKYYGYDKWWEALDYAKEVFGEYNVFCGLVWGLESPESTMEGIEFILSRGIGFASNVFHADPHSRLGKYPQPSEEDILKMARRESALFLEYPKAKTIYTVSMRNTLDWEIYRGDLR